MNQRTPNAELFLVVNQKHVPNSESFGDFSIRPFVTGTSRKRPRPHNLKQSLAVDYERTFRRLLRNHKKFRRFLVSWVRLLTRLKYFCWASSVALHVAGQYLASNALIGLRVQGQILLKGHVHIYICPDRGRACRRAGPCACGVSFRRESRRPDCAAVRLNGTGQHMTPTSRTYGRSRARIRNTLSNSV